MNLDEEKLEALIKAMQAVSKAIQDFAAAFIDAAAKFAQIVSILFTDVLSYAPLAWDWFQTHAPLDERYIASPISTALYKIFYSYVPPEFLGLN